MAAGEYDIEVEQGATYRLDVTVQGGDPAVPLDLTGYTARMQIRAKVAATTVLWEMTTEDALTQSSPEPGITILDQQVPENLGRLQLFIADENTALFTWRTGVYDLELVGSTQPGADVIRLLKGKVTVDPEVTREEAP
jgi:hypothetical protein